MNKSKYDSQQKPGMSAYYPLVRKADYRDCDHYEINTLTCGKHTRSFLAQTSIRGLKSCLPRENMELQLPVS